jgi:hypothetical protein
MTRSSDTSSNTVLSSDDKKSKKRPGLHLEGEEDSEDVVAAGEMSYRCNQCFKQFKSHKESDIHERSCVGGGADAADQGESNSISSGNNSKSTSNSNSSSSSSSSASSDDGAGIPVADGLDLLGLIAGDGRKLNINGYYFAKNTIDSEGRRMGGTGWSWLDQDVVVLERLLSEVTEPPVNWDSVGKMMNPVRGAVACQSMAQKKSMAIPAREDSDGRKWEGAGWGWIKKDYDGLRTLLSKFTAPPVDWEAVGRNMNPQRSVASCLSMANKRGMPYPKTVRKVDADGRRLLGAGWSWVAKDFDELNRLISEVGDSPIDFWAIGQQMDPVRSASSCQTIFGKKKKAPGSKKQRYS